MAVDPHSRKLILAGTVVCLGGAAIAVVQSGVGTHAILKGTIVALMGLGMVLHGWLRRSG